MFNVVASVYNKTTRIDHIFKKTVYDLHIVIKEFLCAL